MALKELMQYVIELGFDGKDAERDSERTFDKIGDAAEDQTGRFDGIGGKMGKALVAGFAAVGAGALIMQGINSAMDAKAGVKRLQGQFALTAEEAQKYGDLAGELYAEGWGSGLEEVQQVVGLAANKLRTTTDAELLGISESVLAVSKTWGEDFESIIRSTNQLIENDLAPNAQAALDLIVGAFQNGGNEAGDLLDTIDEYAQHWEAMGLSGEDALNQVIAGFQQGQRDGDKMGDAIKQMFIETTSDSSKVRTAFENIGLDADVMRDKFRAGGDTAREAFVVTIEALKRAQEAGGDTTDAIALIGTQFEDLGPKALEALGDVDGALEDTTGKAAELADTVEATDWAKLQRKAEAPLRSLGGLLTELGNGVFDLTTGAQFSADEIAQVNGTAAAQAADEFVALVKRRIDDLPGKLDAVKDSVIGATVELGAADAKAQAMGNALGTLDGELDAIQSNAPKVADDLEDIGDEAGDAAEEVETLTDRFSDLLDVLDAEDAHEGLLDGIDRVIDAQNRSAESAEEGGRRHEQAVRDEAQAVRDLKRDVIEYADELGDIPDHTVSNIIAMISDGDLAKAEAALNALARTRTATVNVATRGGGAGTPRNGPRAQGGPLYPGVHQVGDNRSGVEVIDDGKGGMLVVSNGGGMVTPADVATRGTAGGVQVHIGTITTNARDGQELLDEFVAALQRQGPTAIKHALGIEG